MNDSSNQIATQSKDFRRIVERSAGSLLTSWVGSDRAAEATGRISVAFASAALAAKNPSDFYACTPASVAQCIAISALTGIMPSTGSASLAYLIPRRPRKNEAPALNYALSHRGICALARRAGVALFAVPCGQEDRIVISDGEVTEHRIDPDIPVMSWDDLRGVVVLVKDVKAGRTIFRGWVPRAIIEARRALSDSYKWAEDQSATWAKERSTWHQWPVEMSIKTALHYAIGRGWVVIDDTDAVRALAADAESDREIVIGQSDTQDSEEDNQQNGTAGLKDALHRKAQEAASAVDEESQQTKEERPHAKTHIEQVSAQTIDPPEWPKLIDGIWYDASGIAYNEHFHGFARGEKAPSVTDYGIFRRKRGYDKAALKTYEAEQLAKQERADTATAQDAPADQEIEAALDWAADEYSWSGDAQELAGIAAKARERAANMHQAAQHKEGALDPDEMAAAAAMSRRAEVLEQAAQQMLADD